ncbi:MAG: hypothetical protein Fur0012_11060 [Elusimicrobiota bacterium]
MREIISISSENELPALRTLFKLAGANAVFARDLNDAFELIERTEPIAVFVTENSDPSAEICLRELKRHTPSLNVCVLLKNRDSERERQYLRLGAFSCISHPWTPEEAATVFSMARPVLLKKIEFKKRKKPATLLWAAAALTLSTLIFLSYISGIKKEKANTIKAIYPSNVKISDPNISGIFFDEGNVYLYDWLLQTVFKYSKKDLSPSMARKLPYDIYRYGSDFITQAVFLSDDGFLIRRAKDESLTVLDKSGPFSGFSQFCFDGIYVWTLDEKEGLLAMRINNRELEILKSFPLQRKPQAISCSARNLYYAYDGYYEAARLQDPQKIIYSVKIDIKGKLAAFAYDSEKIWLVHKTPDGTFLSFIPAAEK